MYQKRWKATPLLTILMQSLMLVAGLGRHSCVTAAFAATQQQRLLQIRSRHPCSIGGLVRLLSSSSTSNHDNDNKNSKNNRNGKVHTVTWKTPGDKDDVTFHAHDGELLRTAALRRGVASPHNPRANLINCRGLGTCGTCAVALDPAGGKDWLPPPNAIERTVRDVGPTAQGGSMHSRVGFDV